jgi:hypothetical protein
MCAFFPKNHFERADGFPRITRQARGQCGPISSSRAENSAVTASIAGSERTKLGVENPCFIEVIEVARRLLIPGPEM